MSLNRKTLCVFLTSLLNVSPVSADDGLEEILIQGTRLKKTPVAVGATEIDPAAISRQQIFSSDTANLLREVPGVSLYGAGGVSGLPVVHGLADDRLRIKVDGMDLVAACPNHMNPALSYLDPSQISTIKVFAGIAPVSAGGDSLGATIIADTVSPTFAQPGEDVLFTGEAGTYYRSNDDARGIHLSATVASDRISLSYSGSVAEANNYMAGDDFKTTVDTGRPGHTLELDEVGSTAYDTRNHALTLAMKNDHHLLEARFGYQDMPEQLYPNQRMDLLENNQHRTNLHYVGSFDRTTVDARVYHEDVDHIMDFGPDKQFWYGSNSIAGAPCSPIRFSGDPSGTCAAGMPMRTNAETVGALLRVDFLVTDHSLLRSGFEYQRYRLDDWWPASGGGMGPGTFWNINDGQRDRTAVFGEWETQLDPNWLASFGIRYEQVEASAGTVHGYNTAVSAPGNQFADSLAFNSADRWDTDHNMDVTLLSRYTMSKAVDFEIGYAHKVRSPSLYERYPWSTWTMAATMNNFVGDGNGYVGDPDLKAEQANTLSAALDWHDENGDWQVKLAPFYTRVADYIDAVPQAIFTSNKFNVLTYENQSARLFGIDLSGKLLLGQTRMGEFNIDSMLSYTQGKNMETKDDLYNIIPLHGRIRLNHQYHNWNSGLEVVLVSSKDEVSDVRNEITTDGYSLVNLSTSYTWRRVRMDLGIENLFDKYYEQPLGGAYTAQGKTMSMNGIPWGIAVPGKGRSFNVAVSTKF